MSTLSPDQLRALRSLRAAFPHAKIALIGASALGLHIEMTWRNSADLDLAIAVAFSELDSSKLPGWQRDIRREHRWRTSEGVLVDLVPAPPEALAVRELVWPESGQRMNLAGIGLALEAGTWKLDVELQIAVPSVALIVLLKMAAYTDGPDERQKDLKDLAHILDEYPSLAEDRIYSADIFAEGLDVPQAQAFILGQEFRDICGPEERKVVERFLQMTSDGAGWSRFVNLGPWRHEEEKLRRKLAALRRGFGA